THQRALDHPGSSLVIEERDQRFADGEFSDRFGHVHGWIRAKRFRGCLDRFLVLWSKGAQGVLHAIAELAQNSLRDVQRVLRDEKDAHTLRTNQSHHLHHFVFDDLWQIAEQQVRFVKKENQFGLFGIAHFRQVFEQRSQQPQEERRIHFRRLIQLVRGEDVHHAMPLRIGLEQIVEVQRRFPKKLLGALLLKGEQSALDCANARRGNIAVLGLELFGVVADILQHGLQILQIQQQQLIVIGNLKNKVEHAFLCVVEIQQPRQQQRAHLRNRGAHGMTLLAEHIPAGDRTSCEAEILQLQFLYALGNLRIVRAWLADSGKIALYIGGEYRHADAAERFRHHLQRYRFSGAGGACH